MRFSRIHTISVSAYSDDNTFKLVFKDIHNNLLTVLKFCSNFVSHHVSCLVHICSKVLVNEMKNGIAEHM